jgi:acyl-CoA reductase-like NAD-dependent aldehyde dehydrogenase
MSNMPYSLTINGERVTAASTGRVINPATESVICEYPLATPEHLEMAVQAARHAFMDWSTTSVDERSEAVRALGAQIESNRQAFIELLTTEQGKALVAAEWEIDGCIHWCKEIAAQRLDDQVFELGEQEVVKRYTPLGVVGAITPWNFPLLLAIWKVAPALMMGNTVILKPSPFTPLCTLWFGELAQSVLPPGVLNVVSAGNEFGQWMTEHPGINKVSFTGSTATGRRVMQSAASNLKRVTLELGGNDAAIVMPDADPKAIAKDLFWACFANSAQFCVAGKRLYIHESIYDAMAAELVAYARTVRMGNGLEAGVELGPLQNRMQYEKVCDLLQDSHARGHKFLLGGTVSDAPGYFIPVTLIDNPPDDARCVVEEAFGPVLPLLKYRSFDEVVRRANDTPYGLAGSVWGQDLEMAERLARRLETGTVWINQAHVFSPSIAFGGHKESGMGIENSLDGLAEYANVQTLLRRKGAA